MKKFIYSLWVAVILPSAVVCQNQFFIEGATGVDTLAVIENGFEALNINKLGLFVSVYPNGRQPSWYWRKF